MNLTWIGTALLGLALALPASAQYDQSQQSQPGQQGQMGKQSQTGSEQKVGEHDSMSSIAQEYNVEETEMRSLRDKGWSWNEVGNALAISKRSGKPLQEVVTQRDSGLSWNQIADRYGFRFGEVSKEAKQAARDGKRLEREDRRSRR